MTSEIQPGDSVKVTEELRKWGIKENMPEGSESEPAVVEEVVKGLGGPDAETDLLKVSHPEWKESYFVPEDAVDKSAKDS